MIGKVKRVMQDRELVAPYCFKSLTAPVLAYEQYKVDLVALVWKLLARCKRGTISLHTPRLSFVEASWEHSQDILFNFKRFMTLLDSYGTVQYNCDRFHDVVGDLGWTSSGHLAAREHTLAIAKGLSAEARTVAVSNAKEMVLPSKHVYVQHVV